jgi:hypothetical protein
MVKAMLFDEAAVTITEQAGEAAAPKALPSHRLHLEGSIHCCASIASIFVKEKSSCRNFYLL